MPIQLLLQIGLLGVLFVLPKQGLAQLMCLSNEELVAGNYKLQEPTGPYLGEIPDGSVVLRISLQPDKDREVFALSVPFELEQEGTIFSPVFICEQPSQFGIKCPTMLWRVREKRTDRFRSSLPRWTFFEAVRSSTPKAGLVKLAWNGGSSDSPIGPTRVWPGVEFRTSVSNPKSMLTSQKNRTQKASHSLVWASDVQTRVLILAIAMCHFNVTHDIPFSS